MTSERKRGSVTPWKGQWRVRLTVEGTRRNLGLFRTREEADEVLEAALVQLADRPSGLTLLAWGEKWLDRRERSPAHRSSQKDRSRWRTHVVAAPFATKLLRRIERRDVVAWVRELLRTPAKTAKTSPLTKTTTLADAERTLSRQTVVHALNLLRASLAEALDDDLVRENVADGVRVLRRIERQHVLAWVRSVMETEALTVKTFGRGETIIVTQRYAHLSAESIHAHVAVREKEAEEQ